MNIILLYLHPICTLPELYVDILSIHHCDIKMRFDTRPFQHSNVVALKLFIVPI